MGPCADRYFWLLIAEQPGYAENRERRKRIPISPDSGPTTRQANRVSDALDRYSMIRGIRAFGRQHHPNLKNTILVSGNNR